MTNNEPIDLYARVTSDTVLEVRSGKMKLMKGLSTMSAIDKQTCDGSVKVTSNGIEDDEHDYTVRTRLPLAPFSQLPCVNTLTISPWSLCQLPAHH